MAAAVTAAEVVEAVVGKLSPSSTVVAVYLEGGFDDDYGFDDKGDEAVSGRHTPVSNMATEDEELSDIEELGA
jgi:hypothetical protein